MNKRENTSIIALGVVIILVAAVIITAAVIIVSLVFGNPISKAIARNKVEDYLSAVFDESTVGSGSYNIIREEYVFDCTVDGVDRSIAYADDKLFDEYADRYFSEKFDDELSGVRELMETDFLTFYGSCDVEYIVANEQYSKAYDDLTIEATLHLYIINTDFDLPEEYGKETAAQTVVDIINACDDISYAKSIDIEYIGNYGEYFITLQNEEITVSDVLANMIFKKNT